MRATSMERHGGSGTPGAEGSWRVGAASATGTWWKAAAAQPRSAGSCSVRGRRAGLCSALPGKGNSAGASRLLLR